MSHVSVPAPPSYPSYLPEQCPFQVVMVDVTHRCNMACRNCYLPNRSIPDLDAEWLSSILARLPAGREIRLVGAEPTLRRDLPQIIRDVRARDHHPVILTNGLRLADREYVGELKAAGLRVAYLSMNGAFDDDYYAAIDDLRCADKKARAFANLAEHRVTAALGMIVVRGVNEGAMAPLLAAAQAARNVRELHFRSVGSIGRFMSSPPYDLGELAELFTAASGVSPGTLSPRGLSPSSLDFRFGRLRIQLTQWPDLGSEIRGRLTPEGTVAPFFEHVIANEGGF